MNNKNSTGGGIDRIYELRSIYEQVYAERMAFFGLKCPMLPSQKAAIAKALVNIAPLFKQWASNKSIK